MMFKSSKNNGRTTPYDTINVFFYFMKKPGSAHEDIQFFMDIQISISAVN